VVRRFSALLFSVLFGIGVTEIAVRAIGFRPFLEPGGGSASLNFVVPDEVFGWKLNPGTYSLAAPTGSEHTFVKHTLDDGTVDVGRKGASSPDVILLGCSLMWGFGLNDQQMFSWKLQQLCPESTVRNEAVLGYGTLQALMRMEHDLASVKPSPKRFIYGFIEHHEERNVGTPFWVRTLISNSSEGDVQMPYCDVGPENSCKRTPVARMIPAWTLPGRSILLDQIIYGVMQFASRDRRALAREVTKSLLIEMASTAKRAGVDFSVMLLDGSKAVTDEYAQYLRANRIDVIDCNLDPAHSEEMWNPANKHPTEKLNDAWIECLRIAQGGELCRVK
jgi:hypothetical protein